MKRAAHFISFVFSPLLVPVYGVALALWFSQLCFLSGGSKFYVLMWVAVINTVIPASMILVLKQMGLVSDFGLNNRRDRTLPYCIVCLGYLSTAFLFSYWRLPSWMALFMAGAAIAVVISMIVNVWWKISAHLAGMGGMIGLMLRIYADHSEMGASMAALLAVTLLTGLVGSARVYLGRHTLGQVVAGTINGAVCVYIVSGLW